MLKLITELAQPFLVAVTFTAPTMSEPVVLDAYVKAGIGPVPLLEPMPIKAAFAEGETLQLNIVPGSVLVAVKLIAP